MIDLENIIECRDVEFVANASKDASIELSCTSIETRNAALKSIQEALLQNMSKIIAANAKDVDDSKANNISESLIDRLVLDEKRILDIAQSIDAIVDEKDYLGIVLEHRTLYNNLDLKRISVPFGVVAVIFEARPNVAVDAAVTCIKSGNSIILKGSSMAKNSNKVLVEIMQDAICKVGICKNAISSIDSSDHSCSEKLIKMHGIVDVLIPRGSAKLINYCVENSSVPIIETGTGNCHVYIHSSADLDMALNIVINAKCRRFGVCNATETLLVDQSVANQFLPKMLEALDKGGILIHADETAYKIAQENNISVSSATKLDWATEYLAAEIAVKVVRDIDDAINHINKYGTKHSEAIVATDNAAINMFCARVDAAVVYANASTAFSDGGEFGMGAEIGISTQKLHVRGPFATQALTTYKYIITGTGQTRS